MKLNPDDILMTAIVVFIILATAAGLYVTTLPN